MQNSITQKAIKAAGGPGALAKALRIKQPAVSQWDQVPALRVLAVETLTGISRYKLRPDIYGKAP